MCLGVVMLLSAFSIFMYNVFQARQAEKAIQAIIPEIKQQIENSGDSSSEMAEVDGYTYIGYLSIPSLDLELPIMDDWDMERMKIAPCRYFGSVKSKDLVIAGHNYVRLFGRLQRLKIGDSITFTDVGGNVTSYEVYELEVLPSTAVDEMVENEAALTIFTCTYSGQARFTVRCELSEN